MPYLHTIVPSYCSIVFVLALHTVVASIISSALLQSLVLWAQSLEVRFVAWFLVWSTSCKTDLAHDTEHRQRIAMYGPYLITFYAVLRELIYQCTPLTD